MMTSSTSSSGQGPHVVRIVFGIALLAWASGVAIAQTTNDAMSSAAATTSMLIYDANALANVHGGARRGSNYQGMLRWQISADGDRAWGWSNTTAYINLMATHQAGPDLLTGDAQGVSNIQAPSGVRIEEAWLQRNFLDGRLSALIGRYDLNSEFYRLNSAGLFLNSSFGIGPEFSGSGHGGPSIFPSTSLGVRIDYKPASNVVVRAAMLDGVPVDREGGGTAAFRGSDGLLFVYELAWLNRPGPSGQQRDRRFLIGRASGLNPYQDKIAFGGWHYTAEFDDLSELDPRGQPVRRQGSSGVYVIGDKLLYQSASQPPRKLAGFVQLGTADARVNRFGTYLGMGVVATGFVPGRPTDEFGLGLAIARNSNHYLLSQQGVGPATRRAEATVEMTYLSQLSPHVSIQPNLQYVIHPNTVATVSDALTLQLRAEIAF
jgi:porin